jgi:hypothetical protein
LFRPWIASVIEPGKEVFFLGSQPLPPLDAQDPRCKNSIKLIDPDPCNEMDGDHVKDMQVLVIPEWAPHNLKLSQILLEIEE